MKTCPHCDSPNTSNRTDRDGTKRQSTPHDYYCKSCKQGFNTPAEKERERPSSITAKHGMARTLEQMDKEDL